MSSEPENKASEKSLTDLFVKPLVFKNALDVEAIIFMMKLFASDNFRKAVRYLEGDPRKLKKLEKYLKDRGADTLAAKLYKTLSRESYSDAAKIWWYGSYSTQAGMKVVIDSLVKKMKDQIKGFDTIFELPVVNDGKNDACLHALLRVKKTNPDLLNEEEKAALKESLAKSVQIDKDDIDSLIQNFRDNQDTIMRAFQLPKNRFDTTRTKVTFDKVKKQLESEGFKTLIDTLIQSNLVKYSSSAKFTPKNYADLVAFLTASTLAGVLAALVKFLEPNFAKWPMGLNIATGIATVLVLFLLPMLIRKITTAVVKWHYNKQVSKYTDELKKEVPEYKALFEDYVPKQEVPDNPEVPELVVSG